MATFTEVKGSFQVLIGCKNRNQLPSCEKMEKFIEVITKSKPTWSEEDQGAFNKLVAEQMPPMIFERFQNNLRTIAGLPLLPKTKKKITWDEVVASNQQMKQELSLLRETVKELKAAMARKGKAKKTNQPELPM